MGLHLPIEPLKPALGWMRYRDANLVPTSPLADDISGALVSIRPRLKLLVIFICADTGWKEPAEDLTPPPPPPSFFFLI